MTNLSDLNLMLYLNDFWGDQCLHCLLWPSVVQRKGKPKQEQVSEAQSAYFISYQNVTTNLHSEK